jgi:hypothetical protein
MRMQVFAIAMLAYVPACSQAREQSEPQQQQSEDGAISGVVVNGRGQPVAGATVSVSPIGRPIVAILPSVETDDKGTFTLNLFAWGKYAVCAHKESDGYRDICNNIFTKDSAPVVILSAQAAHAGIVVKVGPKAGLVIGTVKDAATGAPLDAVLRFHPSSDNGRFIEQSISPQFDLLMPPDADLELEINAPGYLPWRSSVDNYQNGKPFRIKSEEKRTLEIRLWPQPH